MAFGSIGSLGHTSAKASGQTLSLSPSRSVPAGRLIVVCVAWGQVDGNYTDGAVTRDENYACTDDAGNIYTTLTCGFSSGFFAVSEAMFITYVDEPLTTSSVITITARQTNAIPKAMTVWEFSIGAGKRWAIYKDHIVGFENNDHAADPGTSQPAGLSISGLPNTEHLFLHCLANLRPSSDSYSWDADYTQFDPDGTTGGAASDNVTVRAGFRIVTATGDVVSVSDTTSNSHDVMQGYCALTEIDYDDDFPTFPNLDQFNRPDEDPLSSPPWSSSTTVIPGQGTALLRVDSHECARSASGTFHGAMFWDEYTPAGDDGEVFCTLAVVGHAGLHMFALGSGQNATLSGYATYWLPYSDARPDRILWGDTGNTGGIATRFMITWLDQLAGGKWGLQLRENGQIVQQWADDGNGWRWVGAAINDTGSSSYFNEGHFGLNLQNDFTVRVDDFGGGTSIRFVPHIIRRPPDPAGVRRLE